MHFSLGAINKDTNEYIFPIIATKNKKYICIECNRDVILCKGNIKAPYFRHKIDNENKCTVYTHPTESQIHKDAKMLIKSLIENNIDITILKCCNSCKTYETQIIQQKDLIVKLEYRFEYNGLKIADVACVDKDNKIYYIFEIYNTHKTRDENRPEPWFEINAKDLIRLVNETENIKKVTINCLRNNICKECVNKEIRQKELKKELTIFREKMNGILTQKRLMYHKYYILEYNKNNGRNEFAYLCLKFLTSINENDVVYTKEFYTIVTLYTKQTIKINTDLTTIYMNGIKHYYSNNNGNKNAISILTNTYYEGNIFCKKHILETPIIKKIDIINIKHQIKVYKNLLQFKSDNKYKKKIYELIMLLKLNNNGIKYSIAKGDIIIQNKNNKDVLKIKEYNDKTYMTICQNSNYFYCVKMCDIVSWYNSAKYEFLSKIYLNVKYEDKDKIKVLKGSFDCKLKCWYIFSNNYSTDDILKQWKIVDVKSVYNNSNIIVDNLNFEE